MLHRLAIRGLALFEDVTLELAPGLNVITGETGAGKSLVLSAIGLVLGARASAFVIRDGAEAALVEAAFRIEPGELGAVASEELAPGEALRLTRTLRRSGRGHCTLGGRSVSLARLAEAGRVLASSAVQHAQLELGTAQAFSDALDALAGQNELRTRYGALYSELALARAELTRLELAVGGREAMQKRLRDQIAALERLAPRPGEWRTASDRLTILRRSQQYLELAAQVSVALREREQPIEDELAALTRAALRLDGSARSVRELQEALRRAQLDIEECVRAAERLKDDLDAEPAELELLEARYAELERAGRALDVEPGHLAEELVLCRQRLDDFDDCEDRLGSARARVERALAEAESVARVLHDGRTRHAQELEQRIASELAGLCLQGARVRIELSELAPAAISAAGLTHVALSFAANPGEPFCPLGEVASGGERSRLLLALRCLGLDGSRTTLIFDEIDSGVGGIAADAVAERLARAAAGRQVVCVTHQACIAARADAHFRVYKTTNDGRTRAQVELLRGPRRVDELSRMLAGRSSPDTARALASDLLRRVRPAGHKAA